MNFQGLFILIATGCALFAIFCARLNCRIQSILGFDTLNYSTIRTSTHWLSTFHKDFFLSQLFCIISLLIGNVLILIIGREGTFIEVLYARAGGVAAVNLIFLLLASTRRNVIARLVKQSHLEIFFLHNWLGGIIFIEVILHIYLHDQKKSLPNIPFWSLWVVSIQTSKVI
jgi:hypothetical protein